MFEGHVGNTVRVRIPPPAIRNKRARPQQVSLVSCTKPCRARHLWRGRANLRTALEKVGTHTPALPPNPAPRHRTSDVQRQGGERQNHEGGHCSASLNAQRCLPAVIRCVLFTRCHFYHPACNLLWQRMNRTQRAEGEGRRPRMARMDRDQAPGAEPQMAVISGLLRAPLSARIRAIRGHFHSRALTIRPSSSHVTVSSRLSASRRTSAHSPPRPRTPR